MSLCRFLIVPDEVLSCLLIEELDELRHHIEVHLASHRNIFCQSDGRNDHYDLIISAAGMEVVLGTKELGYFDYSCKFA